MKLAIARFADSVGQAIALLQIDGCISPKLSCSPQPALVSCACDHAARTEQFRGLDGDAAQYAAGGQDQYRLTLLQLSSPGQGEVRRNSGCPKGSGHSV